MSHTNTLLNQPLTFANRPYPMDPEIAAPTTTGLLRIGVVALIFSALASLVIPGIVALILAHGVLARTTADVPATDHARGYAIAALIVTYSTFAVFLLGFVLPHLLTR